MGVGATRFGISITVFSIGSGGTVDYIVVFEMEGGWTCLAEIWLEEESSDIRLVTGLLIRSWSVIRENFMLNRSTILADDVTSLRQMYPCLANAGHPTSWWNYSFGGSSG